MRRALWIALWCCVFSSEARAQPGCVDAPPPPPPRNVNVNNGLPALGSMVMAAGTGVGLVAVFSAVIGTAGVAERAERRSDVPLLLALVATGTTALLALSAFTLLLGASIWFVAWLPPITDTRVRCPPKDN